ncbi:MAG: hypothetical protein K9H26_05970 [Prolixibacteraceae bacterium]|nr:hypothetical protein [Prolixibacteraceae bacterium]
MRVVEIRFLDTPSAKGFVPILYKILVVVLFAYLFQSAFVRCMYSYTDHDDNPYIAGAKITAEDGLLPYKDYRCIHMPYYVFTYSLILKATTSLTFTAKIISLASFFLMLVLIFYSIQNALAMKNQIFRFMIGASALIFIINNPFTQYALARFTYDLPLLLTISSFLILISLENKKHFFFRAAISGLLLGIAIGFRLHFIMFTVPFALSLLLFLKYSKSEKLKLFICFSCAVFAGLIPVFILFAIAPQEFMFDMHDFHFNIDMKAQPGAALPLGTKLSNIFLLMRDEWQALVLLILTAVVLVLKLFKLLKNDIVNFRINLLLITLPFIVYLSVRKLLLIQYLYPISVFLILFVFYGVSALKKHANYAAILVFIMSIFMIFDADYSKFRSINNPKSWYALNRNKISTLVDEAISGKARVLTLSPAEIIESDSITIYKEFVSSPFLWRNSHLIPEDVREKFNIISPKEAEKFMQENQPDAILTGYYPESLEMEFIEFAQNNDYLKVELPTQRKLKLYIKQ